MSTIADTESWSRLAADAETISGMHLRDLMQDASRCAALTAEHDGILLDYSRENLTEPIVANLIALAHEAKLPEKIAAMASGKNI